MTFRSRRELDERDRADLFRHILKLDGRKWTILALTVLPDRTEMLVSVEDDANGTPYELSDLVEKAKTGASKAILKRTEERFPPFYGESYDHIVRDEEERETFYDALIDGGVHAGLAEIPEDYATLYVRDAGGPDDPLPT